MKIIPMQSAIYDTSSGPLDRIKRNRDMTDFQLHSHEKHLKTSSDCHVIAFRKRGR